MGKQSITKPSLTINTNNNNVRTPSIKALNNSGNLQNLAAITESVVIVTPKRASTLPPSIEKGETTFNLIGLVLDGNDENGKGLNKSIIIDSNVSSKSKQNSIRSCRDFSFQLNLNHEDNNDDESNDTNPSNQSDSIIDILNESV
eukprot:CAMPEP_0201597384 /NCGR_PEP_ID=MMETSP0190_2-20130828/193914_1 /ASSEMBLY_ACC=CAM_ASM_000263 /TAXON_ID=37353 /ORGANISM="Rosalina sp." /LENGTH=144 /DNA_ID=CAMNT_0048058371 /DNA_START=2468 /DNA_END=2905 /DNA_ORIENTATION=-